MVNKDNILQISLIIFIFGFCFVMNKNWLSTILLVNTLLLSIYGLNFTSGHASFKENWNCNNQTNSERKEYCENELSFAKFTEITGTREMSTTCCSFVNHDPFTNFFNYRVSKLGGVETIIEKGGDSNAIYNTLKKEWDSFGGINERYHKLFLELSSEAYAKSKNREKTLNILSSLYEYCSDTSKNEVVRAVCEYFSYDLIGRNPKLSKIQLGDVLKTFKNNKILIKRTGQFSDLDENYTPINYHYSVIRSMYMIGDYALGIMDGYDYLKPESNTNIDRIRIMILKAGDTHRQDFAEINLKDLGDYPLSEMELIFDGNNLYLTIGREYWSDGNIYYQGTLEGTYKFNEDGTRTLYQCNMIIGPRYGEDSEKKKEKQSLSKCEQDLGVTITTIL